MFHLTTQETRDFPAVCFAIAETVEEAHRRREILLATYPALERLGEATLDLDLPPEEETYAAIIYAESDLPAFLDDSGTVLALGTNLWDVHLKGGREKERLRLNGEVIVTPFLPPLCLFELLKRHRATYSTNQGLFRNAKVFLGDSNELPASSDTRVPTAPRPVHAQRAIT